MKALYPANWPQLAHDLKQEVGWRCECTGICGRGHHDRCPEEHGKLAVRGRRDFLIVLTVAHLDHDPTNNQRANLMVACQGCHLHYDRFHHRQTRVILANRALEQAGQMTLT